MNKTVAVAAKFSVKKILFSCMSMACALFISAAAHAQVVEGCSPAVLDAMQKKAQARVAYDVAVTEQVVVKPDSVLAMTCFGKAAGVSAERGGNLFSGSFFGNTNFASVITDALSAFFSQFADAEGFDTPGVVDYAATNLEDDADCPGIENLWERIKEKGVAGGVPYLTMAELIAGAAPGGSGARFTANWDTANADGIFQQLNDAIAALPVAAIPVFNNNMTFCQVLQAAGATCP
ncbi:MAG: hypothetical protein Q8K65_05340 [Alphaproteobacteria bacterium]|nr:hypothetical protein [Alphaproteobacteria bacterium]